MTKFPRAEQVDVLLLLEGTFPYVSGGVSSWVFQLINSFPDIKFGAAFLGSNPSDYNGLRYELPENLIHFEQEFLFNWDKQDFTQEVKASPNLKEQTQRLHDWFKNPNRCPLNNELLNVDYYFNKEHGVSHQQFLHSQAAWEYIKSCYEESCTDPSFVDYFWTVRNMHSPIWRVANLCQTLPEAKVYHTVSTGYAGFLGALLRQKYQKPFILSEHGIYTKERRIDLLHNAWLEDEKNLLLQDVTEISYMRQLWIRFFESLARICYDAADPIISLFDEYNRRQIEAGASPDRTCVIANGIEPDKFQHLRDARDNDSPPILCLLGRVVAIKDVKTFIRAMHSVLLKVPEAEAWIVGPVDEEPEYATECKQLISSLGLDDKVKLLGLQKIQDILPKVKLMVLSSISEGLPLVVLEAYASGIPCVCTNVGSCKQLIEGLPGDDAALGKSGDVVDIANPQALAESCIYFLKNEEAWQQASKAGLKRVSKFYNQADIINQYRAIYRKHGGCK